MPCLVSKYHYVFKHTYCIVVLGIKLSSCLQHTNGIVMWCLIFNPKSSILPVCISVNILVLLIVLDQRLILKYLLYWPIESHIYCCEIDLNYIMFIGVLFVMCCQSFALKFVMMCLKKGVWICVSTVL